MTTLTKCNKCKKTFAGFFNTTIKRYSYSEFIGHTPQPELDLCKDCDKLFMEWLEK